MEKFNKTGKNFAKLRDLNGLTQGQVAKMLKINRAELSNYETGKRPAPLDALNRLSELYGTELTDILELNEKDLKLKRKFVFGAKELNELELNTLADFRKIIRNYINMRRIEQKA
jgi:transcriptional regulator with XRE-family HTH domain